MTFDEQAATLDRKSIAALLASNQQLTSSVSTLASDNDGLNSRVKELTRQVEWFKRQLFGSKSERRLIGPDGQQLSLGEWGQHDSSAPGEAVTIAEHRRRRGTDALEKAEEDNDLRFDDSVPVEEIHIANPVLDDPAVEHEVIGEKTTYRLAQRPGSYVVLKYIRPVVKRKCDGIIVCPPAPASVFGKGIADVSLLAGMAIDKFTYHLPLYRQHQRMTAAGIHLARSTLTNWVHRTADLLKPIFDAQLASILTSNVLTMDETPIKAGRKGHGKMKTGYFWPVYGDRDEIVFPFSPSRAGAMVREVLGEYCGVLITDGYQAYEKYASGINGLVHAQCWSHTRRHFLKAEDIEPALTESALEYIRQLYKSESVLSRRSLSASKKLEQRSKNCKPIVDEFFEWLKNVLENQALLPSNPFTAAAGYALDREHALRVFLEYPDVPIDTNHLEREIRPIAVGRRNWLFCWTEVGAECVGIFQSLLSTCRLQGVDPYAYLVDVLQRVDDHPAAEVRKLTPRLWKENFAECAMRSGLDRERMNSVL